MENRYNPILNTDSYKASHYLQYPPSTSYLSCYIESRGGKFPNTVFFGLQMYLKEYLSKPVTRENIHKTEIFFKISWSAVHWGGLGAHRKQTWGLFSSFYKSGP